VAEAYLVDAVRTPVGRRGGGLAGAHAADLGAHVIRALLARTDVDPLAVDDVVFGCVDTIGPQAGDIARTAWLAAGLPEAVPGVTVDRQCGAAQRPDQAAQPGGRLQAVQGMGTQQPVRHPVGPGGDHRAGDVAGQVDLLDRARDGAVAGQQEPGAHGDPGGAVRQCGGQATAVEEPAGRDDRDVNSVDDLGDQQAGRHRADVAAALGAGGDYRVDAPGRHLLGVPAGADRRDGDDPGVAQPADELPRGGPRERGDRHPLRDDQLDPLPGICSFGAQVHPERSVGPLPHLFYCITQLCGAHGRRGDDAECAGLRSRRGEPRAGYVPHPGRHDGVADAGQRGQRRADQPGSRGAAGTSASRRPAGSRRSRIRASSSGVGSRVTGTSPGMASGKPVAAATSLTGTPGWTERSRMA
jgi:Thiolase, N-terminal domain